MFDKLKDFFLNKALGRIAVRAGASLAAYLASGAIGVHISVDPAELSAALVTLVNLLITKLKPREAPKA